MLFYQHEKHLQGEFSSSNMPSKVVQDLTSTGPASRGGAAQEQRPVGRPSTRTYPLAPPSSPPWLAERMTCAVLCDFSVCVTEASRAVAYMLRGVCHLECQNGMFTCLVSFCVAAL